MKQPFPKDRVQNPLAILRKAGYAPSRDPITGEESYILRITGAMYPRMHLYVEDHNEHWTFSLHLDQKKASYKGSRMHSGEYDGPVVEREMIRIVKWVEAETGYSLEEEPKPAPKPVQQPQQDSQLFGGIF